MCADTQRMSKRMQQQLEEHVVDTQPKRPGYIPFDKCDQCLSLRDLSKYSGEEVSPLRVAIAEKEVRRTHLTARAGHLHAKQLEDWMAERSLHYAMTALTRSHPSYYADMIVDGADQSAVVWPHVAQRTSRGGVVEA